MKILQLAKEKYTHSFVQADGFQLNTVVGFYVGTSAASP